MWSRDKVRVHSLGPSPATRRARVQDPIGPIGDLATDRLEFAGRASAGRNLRRPNLRPARLTKPIWPATRHGPEWPSVLFAFAMRPPSGAPEVARTCSRALRDLGRPTSRCWLQMSPVRRERVPNKGRRPRRRPLAWLGVNLVDKHGADYNGPALATRARPQPAPT